MVVRAGGKTHYFLVRGTSRDSVVQVLHKQLIKAGRLPKSTINLGSNNPRIRSSNSKRNGSTTFAPLVATVLAGLIATIVGLIRAR